MKSNTFTRIFATICLTSLGSIFAQDTIENAPAVPETTAATLPQQGIEEATEVKMNLEKEFDAFKKENGIIAFGKPTAGGRVFYTGSQMIDVRADNANFIRNRAFAYEKAYQNALASAIRDAYGSIYVETIQKYIDNEATDLTNLPISSPEEITNEFTPKVNELTEEKLNGALQQEGIDAEKIANNNVPQKQRLFQDTIIKKSIMSAIAKSTGFLPVYTFEVKTANGTYAIGVVLCYDASTVEIARCLANKQRTFVDVSKAMPLVDAVNISDEELISEFGVRLCKDEMNQPALLSYGQYGVAYNGTSTKMAERALKKAQIQAEALADEALTTFINSQISIVNTSIKGEDAFIDRQIDANHVITEADVTHMIDSIFQNTKTVAQDSLAGRSTVNTKTLKHASGRYVVCVTRCWSFAQLDTVKAIINTTVPNQQHPVQPVQPTAPSVKRGRTYSF